MDLGQSVNELFKELAKQSGIKFIPFVVDNVEYDYEDVSMDGSEDLQKFAELIVKECSKVICDNGYTRGAFGYEALPPGEIASMIEKHFGVE